MTNKDNLINKLLYEASDEINKIKSNGYYNDEIDMLEKQIDHFRETGWGDIEYAERKLRNLKENKAVQEYYDEHPEELPQPKKSKNGKKTLYEYKADTVDSYNGELHISNRQDKFIYATDIRKARDGFVKRFRSKFGADVGINIYNISEVYE